MKKIVLAFTVILALVGSAVGAVVYQNDFGTQAQFDALAWSATSNLELVAGVGDPPGDLDGDGLFSTVRCTSSFTNWRYGTKGIYAVPFHVLSNPTVSGYGAGFISNHSSGASWSLSQDGGATREYTATSDNSNLWKQYSTAAAAHTDPAYTRVPMFYATTGVRHYSGGAYSTTNTGRMGALQVAADSSLANVGENVYIHLNDFGTQSQRDAWTLSDPANTAFDANPAIDTDQDNLAARVRSATPGGKTLMIRIDAPEGYRFANPIASGLGYGSANNFGSSTRVQLSLDGVNWDVTSTVPGAVNGWYAMTADSTGTAGYDDLTSVWLRIAMSSWHTSWLPQAQDVKVSAEIIAIPEPATMLLLSLGALPLLRRRR